MIKVNDVSFAYGKIQALRNISFEVEDGSICAIVGANGSGKSTLLKCIAGLLRPQQGTMEYNGEKLPNAAYAVVHKGISLIPEGRWVFPQLSVLDNLNIGAYTVDKAAARKNLKDVYERFPKLEARKHQRAGTLSGGEQQMLVVGRALMCNPKVLLMDEPSLGLAPMIINEIFDIIRQINKEGVTILLVEQNAKKALALADKAFLLETGRIVKAGTGAELAADPDVIATYLG
ncbi:ABC transporter ATP-binding protein, partial [Christensenellaceae bacterium OttesenSCG-928-M15]|nr:ABC transporter ATP-binding protein [Christensenellaceae bacterium OttesenSCG-928-M15]